MAVMADTKICEQCGTSFAPRREHARFCSARCRVAWNRHNASDPPAETGALGWSITAMRETTGRLLRATDWDRANGFAVISEAVWWVTMVDATLMRYHPDIYSRVLAGQDPASAGSPRTPSPGCGSSGTGWATTPTPRTSSSR